MVAHPLGKFRPPFPVHRSVAEKEAVIRLFRSFYRTGTLDLDFFDGMVARIGDGRPPYVRLAAPRLFDLFRVLASPEMNSGKTYMDGKWFIIEGKLSDFLKLSQIQERATGPWILYELSKLRAPFILSQRLVARWRRLSCKIHYNLDEKLFQCILGPKRIYSCAFFVRDGLTIDDAQAEKINTTISRLSIPDETTYDILDVGCGWGELTRVLADRYPKANITGITISESQYRHCVEHAGERSNLQYFCSSYDDFIRRNPCKFDRIVSIGMLEHVGVGMLNDYFKTIFNAMRAGSIALIHSIVTETPSRTNAWLEKYIFPGGYIPHISEVISSIQSSLLKIVDIRIYQGFHYANTLAAWRHNFYKSIQDGVLDDYEPQIIRMLDFYLSSAETGFDRDVRNNKVAQFVVERIK